MKNLFFFLLLLIYTAACVSLIAQTENENAINDSIDACIQDSINFNLIMAAVEGDMVALSKAIHSGADIDATTDQGVSALMYASQEGHTEIVKLLIHYGSNVNLSPFSGVTALIGASIRGNEDIADLLIQNGANVNAIDDEGISPLLYAAAFGYYILADMLIFYDADLTFTDNAGHNAVHIASYTGFQDIVALLIGNGVSIDLPDKDGNTPLMLASQQGNMEVVKILVEKGSDIQAMNHSETDALTFAIANYHDDIAVYLEKQGVLKSADKESLEKLVNLAYERHNKKILKSIGIHPGLMPHINKISLNLDMSANGGDFLCGGGIGITDSKNNLNLDLGFQTRPWSNRVLLPVSENTFYQLWETRSWYHASLGKDLYLFTRLSSSHGISIGVRGLLTYGEYRGSKRKVKKEFLTALQIGWFSDFKFVKFGIGYEYLDLNTLELSPHRINFSMKFFINLVKQHKLNNKIYWLE